MKAKMDSAETLTAAERELEYARICVRNDQDSICEWMEMIENALESAKEDVRRYRKRVGREVLNNDVEVISCTVNTITNTLSKFRLDMAPVYAERLTWHKKLLEELMAENELRKDI